MLHYLWLTGVRMNKYEKGQPVMGAKHNKWHLEMQDLRSLKINFYLKAEMLESTRPFNLARFAGVCEVKESNFISIIAEYVSATS